MLIALYFIVVQNAALNRIVSCFTETPDIYLYLTGWLDGIIYRLVFLVLTAAFYYLADFGFEERGNRVRVEDDK